MIEPLLKSHLEPVVARHRQLRNSRRLATCWTVASLAGVALMAANRIGHLPVSITLPALVIAAGASALWIRLSSEWWQPDYNLIAREIEAKHPGLHALLRTAVEQKPDPLTGKLSFLQERVVLEAIAESQRHQWIEAVPTRRLRLSMAAHAASFVLFLMTVLMLYETPQGRGLGRIAARIERDSITVTPGDVSVERGAGVVIMAKFTGQTPGEATLVMQPLNQQPQRIPLARNLSDPTFGHSLAEVSREFTYRIEYGTKVTREFKVSVFEFPRLEHADAELTFPDYTKLPAKTIKDTRRVSAVEGTTLEVKFHLNKPVKSASLVGRDESPVALEIATNAALASLRAHTLAFPEDAAPTAGGKTSRGTYSKTYQLRLVDADGRTNKVPAQFSIEVTRNRAPELKFIFPKGDQRVTPLQEVTFQGEAWDDFGLQAYGLGYTVAGKEPVELTLGTNGAPDEKRTLNFLLRLEELGVQPDELVSYYLWADDLGPGGIKRRTTTDLYFAEVRPFEQIFKPGQTPEGGQSPSGQGNKAQELAEIQKQIMTATWNVQRQQPANLKKAPATSPPKRVNF